MQPRLHLIAHLGSNTIATNMSIPVLLGLDPLDFGCGDDGARLDVLLDGAQNARHVLQVLAR